ncbi:protein of unknown function [Nitrospira defluvii]|jgi:hypothetical protein|uniref:Uncharacterized protein n=1 Tax=Nitrospira defluvii TaxID=330214 RepID=D8P9Q3_9BACT|nr:protein of unknown function [Nitrospira defluvii]
MNANDPSVNTMFRVRPRVYGHSSVHPVRLSDKEDRSIELLRSLLHGTEEHHVPSVSMLMRAAINHYAKYVEISARQHPLFAGSEWQRLTAGKDVRVAKDRKGLHPKRGRK